MFYSFVVVCLAGERQHSSVVQEFVILDGVVLDWKRGSMIASICPYNVCSTDGSNTEFLDTAITLHQSSKLWCVFWTILHTIHLK